MWLKRAFAPDFDEQFPVGTIGYRAALRDPSYKIRWEIAAARFWAVIYISIPATLLTMGSMIAWVFFFDGRR